MIAQDITQWMNRYHPDELHRPVVIELPDKKQVRMNGVRFDKQTRTFVVEVSTMPA